MAGPEWSELVDAIALDRPIRAWRRRPRTVGELMRTSVAPEHLDFLVQGNRRVTHGTFNATVEAGAFTLAQTGVQPGDRVMIVLYNSPEFWLLQCATWRLGAVPVLGNRWWSASELDEAVMRIRPALLATDLGYDARAMRLTPSDVSSWWRQSPPAEPAVDPDSEIREDDVAAIVFTAGSTGAPKAVQLSHRALVWTQQTAQVLRGGGPPVGPADAARQQVALTTTPLFHNGGMVATLGTQLAGGRVVFLRGRFDPAEAMALIEQERVTSWSAVPTMFSRLVRHPNLDRHDLASLVSPASGGAAVTDAFVAELGDRLPAAARGFVSGYGMTEMSFITMVGAEALAAKPGTVGRPLPGVELRVDAPDAEGRGSLIARSGALMVGYLDSPDDEIGPEGWFCTGDVGRIDEDGYVFLTGRSKDMIIRGGENISCQHVEEALLAHGDVLEAAVVGIPDEEFGETVAAIVYRSDAMSDPAALARFAREHLAYFEVPTVWAFIDEPLPVLASGKINKQVLRAALGSGTLSAIALPS